MTTTHTCNDCQSKNNYAEICEKCCEHGDICHDERVCLECGMDMTESLSAAAYDFCKDRMKYGDD